MERARTAQRQWATLSHAERSEHLNRAADAIEANAEALAVLLSREQGKPLNGPNARFEVGACSAWTRATAAFPVEPEVLVGDESGHAELHWTPIGVVGAIGPWNWPVMISIWQIAPALRMGNTVVLKSSQYTPLSVLGLAHVMNQALPDGVLRVLAGDGELGRAITAHDGIDKVTFTGSVETGKAIMRSAADDLKRLTLELGGHDAGIVLEDADPKALAEEQFEPALPIIRYDGHSPPRQGAPQVPRGRDGVAVVVMSRGRMSPGWRSTGATSSRSPRPISGG